MDLALSSARMLRNANVIQQLVSEISTDQARWKPDPDTWSILEVVNHLYDEEREDFRVRLEIILTTPDKPWPAIDPQGWVKTRRYASRDLPDSLDMFMAERRKSIEWLQGLPSPDWAKTCMAPWGGQISAGDMYAAWIAHDLLHTRQLVELHWAYSLQLVAPFEVKYAGTW